MNGTTTDVHPYAQLLARLFAAFGAGDLETVRAALAPAVRLHTPGRSRLAGTVTGVDAAVAHLARPSLLTHGTYVVDVQDILAGDNHAAVLYIATGTRAGREASLSMLAVYRIVAGRIGEVHFLPLDQAAFDAFWA